MSKRKTWWLNKSDDWIIGRDKPWVRKDIDYIKKCCEDKYVLYLGVGTGRTLINFKNSFKLYGIDFIEKFIDTANKIKPKNCELFLDDVVNLKFNKYVDTIITQTCLQHILPEQIEIAVNNICNLNAKNIILWESTNETYKDNGFENEEDNYMWGHDYTIYFSKNNYKLMSKKLLENNITYILHYIKD